MSGAVQFGQLVCAPVLSERLVEILHVIEVLAERVAQQNLAPGWQAPSGNGLRLRRPGRIARCHGAQP